MHHDMTETTPPPDILQSKEGEVAHAMTPSVARVLAGSSNPERFNPDNVELIDTIDQQRIAHTNNEELTLDYQSAETVSKESRADAPDYNTWKHSLGVWAVGQVNVPGAESHEKMEAFKSVGLVEEQQQNGHTVHQLTADAFFDEYLDGKADIEQFVKDISEGCKDGDGIVDLNKLTTRLTAVEPLFNVFGTKKNVNLLVRDYVFADAMLAQKDETRTYVANETVAAIQTPPPEPEKVYLRALQEVAARQTAPETPPAPEHLSKQEKEALNRIIAKTKAKFPDDPKYKTALFGVNCDLDVGEQALIEKVVATAKTNHDTLTTATPHWDAFQTLLESQRSIYGTFGESGRIIEDTTLTEPREVVAPDGGRSIRVPAAIYELYIVGVTIDHTDTTLKGYQRDGSRGETAHYMGENLEALATFIESAPESIKPRESNSETEEKFGEYSAAKTIKHEKKGEPDKAHEDRYLHMPERGAFAVFDGLGGLKGGDRAAELARDFFMDAIRFIPTGLSLEDSQQYLLRLAFEANQLILEEGPKNGTEDMGTTMTLGFIWESPTGEKKLIRIESGDSRAYRIRNGKLEKLTNDSPEVPLDSQARLDNVATGEEFLKLTRYEKNLFQQRHKVDSSLGSSYPKIRVETDDIEDNDAFLLTSDGIHDNLTTAEIAAIALRHNNPDEMIAALIEAARVRAQEDRSVNVRAKADDMTAIFIDSKKTSPARKPADVSQPGETGAFLDRKSIVEQHNVLFEKAQAELGRPLTAQEMYYVLQDYYDPKDLKLFTPVHDALMAARKKRIYSGRQRILEQEMQAIVDAEGETKGKQNPEYIKKDAEIRKSVITYGSLEKALLALKIWGISEDSIRDFKRQSEQIMTAHPPGTGEFYGFPFQFVENDDDSIKLTEFPLELIKSSTP